MNHGDDVERLRLRMLARDESLEDAPALGTASFLGYAFQGLAPGSPANPFFLMHPASCGGSDAEGLAALFAVDTGVSIPVAFIGYHGPYSGYYYLAHFNDHCWFTHSGPLGPSVATIALPSCYCATIPQTLHMTSDNQLSDGGMFQNCTLQYGPTPPEYATLSLGASSFLSTASFTDSNGDSFRYFFACNYTNLTITRVYVRSVLGSPYQDIVRRTWALGLSGNTCSPFLLTNGRTFSGGDPSTHVTISG